MSARDIGLLVNAAIYVAVIVVVVYRQMGRRPLQPTRLVVLPAVLGLIGLQQISRQPLNIPAGAVLLLVVNFILALALGAWRGTTFRLSKEAGSVMMQGTVMTLLAWAVLFALRIPLAYVDFSSRSTQGLVIGELLVALAVTFAAQNAVLWARANRGPGALTHLP